MLQEHAASVELDAVPAYRHLGSVISYKGSLAADVRARLSRAKAEFGEGRRRVFCCPQIGLSKRVILFQQHILSSVMSGAGAWPVLCAGAWTSFEQGLTALHRQLLRLRGEAAQHCTRDEVFTACDAPDPFDLLCLERLRFLSRLLRTGPDAAWALLQNSPDALSAFHSACDWFHCAVRNTSGLACFRTAWTDWVQIMTSSPRRWKGLLKRAAAWHRYRRALRVRWSAFVRASWQTRPVPAYDPSGLLHGCLLCNRAFASFQSWASHAAMKHGYRTRHHQLARGNRCQACGSLFSCLSRLRNHLSSSRSPGSACKLSKTACPLSCRSYLARKATYRHVPLLDAVRPTSTQHGMRSWLPSCPSYVPYRPEMTKPSSRSYESLSSPFPICAGLSHTGLRSFLLAPCGTPPKMSCFASKSICCVTVPCSLVFAVTRPLTPCLCLWHGVPARLACLDLCVALPRLAEVLCSTSRPVEAGAALNSITRHLPAYLLRVH